VQRKKQRHNLACCDGMHQWGNKPDIEVTRQQYEMEERADFRPRGKHQSAAKYINSKPSTLIVPEYRIGERGMGAVKTLLA